MTFYLIIMTYLINVTFYLIILTYYLIIMIYNGNIFHQAGFYLFVLFFNFQKWACLTPATKWKSSFSFRR